MPTRAKVGGVWKSLQQPFVKQGGVWVPTKEISLKSGGVWNKVYASGPASVPAQVTDLQIVDYQNNGGIPTVELQWTPPAGVDDYVLDVWYATNTATLLCWKGATNNADGTGGQRDYVPTRSLTISPAGGSYTYTHSGAVSGSGYLLFRLTPRNSIGAATWPSNAPWIVCATPSTVPLPTPLQSSAITHSTNPTAGSSNFIFSCTPPTINVAAWGTSVGYALVPRVGGLGGGSGFPGYLGRDINSGQVTDFSVTVTFPHGVATAAMAHRNTGNIQCSGNISMIPGYGIVRVPNHPSTTLYTSTLVAAINTYEGGAFPDVGYTKSSYGNNPVDIGSLAPNTWGAYPVGILARSGAETCTMVLATGGNSFLNEFKTAGYGEENELARYGATGGGSGMAPDFVADIDGYGGSRWNWTGSQPVWALQSGMTYTFYSVK